MLSKACSNRAEMVQRSPQVGVGDGTVRVDLHHGPIQGVRFFVPLLAEPHHGKMIECFVVVRIVL